MFALLLNLKSTLLSTVLHADTYMYTLSVYSLSDIIRLPLAGSKAPTVLCRELTSSRSWVAKLKLRHCWQLKNWWTFWVCVCVCVHVFLMAKLPHALLQREKWKLEANVLLFKSNVEAAAVTQTFIYLYIFCCSPLCFLCLSVHSLFFSKSALFFVKLMWGCVNNFCYSVKQTSQPEGFF